MSDRKILWLCSWYPNHADPYNGDFIQRHARATALYEDVHVIHVWPDFSGRLRKPEYQLSVTGRLTEEIILYPAKGGLWGRIMSHQRMMALYRRSIKTFYQQNGLPVLVHVHVPVKAGMAGLWMKKHSGVPMVVTEHWGIYNDIAPDPFVNRSRAFQFFTREIFAKADLCISPSRYLAEGVNRLVAKKEFRIIPNVVDDTVFNFRPHTNKRFRFIHVSNMVALKNPEGILRAFAHYLKEGGKGELVMVGDKFPELRAYAVHLNLGPEQVRFTGEITNQEVAAEMQAADCFILFSNIENSPCVIGEALCCGLPVIATSVGGVPELLSEDDGQLIAATDEKALTAAMHYFDQHRDTTDPVQRAERARKRFGMEAVGKEISESYRGF